MSEPTKELTYSYQTDQQVSVNAFLDVDIEGEPFRLQVTSRYGSTAEKITKTTLELIEALHGLRTSHPKPDRPAPIPQPAAEGGKKFEQKPVPVSDLPPELPTTSEGGASEYFKDEFDYFIVEPKPDEKATVKFYKDKLKYPVGAPINNWKYKSVKEALQAMGDIDPAVAKTYRLAGAQWWTQGNEYTSANGEKRHYKDFRRAEPTL